MVLQHNNQPKVGVRGRSGIGHNLGGMRGADAVPSLGVANCASKKKKIRGLKWPLIDISNATTNQNYVGMMEERKARRFDQGGAWEKRGSIVLRAIELRGDKKLK